MNFDLDISALHDVRWYRRATAADNEAFLAGRCKLCHVEPVQVACTMCAVCFPDPTIRANRDRQMYGPKGTRKRTQPREKKK
jgi:hypothetical protein